MKSTKVALTLSEESAGPITLAPAGRQSLLRLPVMVLDFASVVAGQVGLTMLRLGLALVFVWFGVLKFTGHSDVSALIGVTVPIVSPNVFVPILGVIETLLGIGLLVPKARRWVLAILCMHLTGTFLTFLDAHTWMFHGHNPFLLTVDGEFVLKNFVLISAAVTLLGLTAKNRTAVVPALPVPRPSPEAATVRADD